tara:strand:+ start:66 stop:290 length:225 start_codon:yes stop_codon:yes gene_type:complete
MRDIEDCTKWINKSASTIQEAKFCAVGQEYSDDIKEHLSTALQALVYAQELVNEQINFDRCEFSHDNKEKPTCL